MKPHHGDIPPQGLHVRLKGLHSEGQRFRQLLPGTFQLSQQKKDGEQLLDDTVTTLQDDPLFEETIELKQFFSFLTKLQKQILIAEYVYGYSDAEFSRKLHTTRQAVNRTKNRAIDMLRNFYGKQN